MRTSIGSGADAENTGPALFDLGRATVPLLGLVMFSEGLLGRSYPWLAATLTAAFLTPAICVAAYRLVLGGHRPRGEWPTLLAWLLFCLMALSTVVGPTRVYTDEPVRRIVALACVFFLAHDGVAAHERRVRQLAACLICMCTAVAVTAILRWPVPPGPDGRWVSLLDSPSLLAGLLALSVPVTLAWAVSQAGWRRAGSLALVVPQVAALVGSGCRLPTIATAVAMPALLVAWAAGRRAGSLTPLPEGEGGRRVGARGRVAAGTAAVAVLLVVGVLLLHRPGHESSASHRAFIWETCVTAVRADLHSVLLGAGVGGFRDAFSMHRPWVGTDRSDVLAVVRDAHCDALMIACESGLPAALALIALVVAGIRGSGVTSGPLVGGLGAGLCAWAATGLAHGTMDVLALGVPAMAVLGVRLAPPRPQPVTSPGERATCRSPLLAGAVAAALATVWLSSQASARASELLVARAQREGPGQELLAAAVRLYPSRDALLELSAASPAPQRAGALTLAIRLYPRDAEMHFALSRALVGSERGTARGEADEAVSLDPYNPYYRKWRAVLAGQSPEAKQELRRAIALFERSLEVATDRLGAQSPQAEALRMEIDEARKALGS